MTLFKIEMEQLLKWGKMLLAGEKKEEQPFMNESAVVNDLARDKLCEWIEKNGVRLDSPGKIEASLKKSCPDCKLEIKALIEALQNGVPGDLMFNPTKETSQVLYCRLVKRLQISADLPLPVALWAVESWVLALGLIRQDNDPEPQFDKTSTDPAG
jgi:hypothetical protein